MVPNVTRALRTTCIKNVKFKIIKISTSCQYVGYFYYSENLNWAARNLPLGHIRPAGRGLDIAGLRKCFLSWTVAVYGNNIICTSAHCHEAFKLCVCAYTVHFRSHAGRESKCSFHVDVQTIEMARASTFVVRPARI